MAARRSSSQRQGHEPIVQLLLKASTALKGDCARTMGHAARRAARPGRARAAAAGAGARAKPHATSALGDKLEGGDGDIALLKRLLKSLDVDYVDAYDFTALACHEGATGAVRLLKAKATVDLGLDGLLGSVYILSPGRSCCVEAQSASVNHQEPKKDS